MADRRTRIILSLDADPYVRGLAKAGAATSAFTKGLDSSDSRMGNLVQSALALGPALVPIGAAAVPAVTSLTASLGAAAGAAAVAALAFNGIGDGLKALNDYQLEPSAKNLEKVRQAFEDLGPAGAQFVMFLDKLEPKLDKLQNTARAGLFPGVEDGIRPLLDRAPQVNRIIAEISGALGDLAAEGGDALASDKFDAFFDYIEHNARPVLMDMGRTIGNVTEALGNMLIAFDPVSDGFSNGLLKMSRDFARWSRNLEDNDSFQEFVDYIERVSPEVVDTLGALVVAIADIVEAAAPVGEVTLPIIKTLAQTLGQIADSPVGPVLVATAAGLSALSRAVAVYNVANGSAMTKMIGKLGKARIAAAGVGLLATSFTDLDDKLGLTNTAMGASIGLLGGLKGGVAGLAAGALLDASAAAEDLADAVERANDAMADPTAIREQQAAIKGLKHAIDDNIVQGFDDLQDIPTSIGAVFNALKSGDWDFPDIQDMELDSKRLIRTLANLRDEVKGGPGLSAFTTDLGKLERFASNAAPALKKAGIELKNLDPEDPEWDRAVRAIKRYNEEADSIPGRTKGVRSAIKGLDNPMISAADSADKLDASLSALFDPELDAREALIAWKQGLVDLRKQIRGTSGALNLNTKAGRDNQTAIIAQIRALKDVAVAQAKQDGNSKRATKTLRDGRQAIINAGVESGISADKMRKLVNQMGLVPRIVQPKVDVKGDAKAKGKIKSFQDAIRAVPNALNVFTDTPGSDKSQSEIKGLTKLLSLTPDKHDTKIDVPGSKDAKHDIDLLRDSINVTPDKKDVKTSAPGATAAARDLRDVDKAAQGIDGKNVDLTLTAKAKNVLNQADKVWHQLGLADGGTVDYYANGDVRNGHTAQIAPAGAWRVWAEPETGGEAYIPLAPQKRTRSLDIWQETGRRLGVEGYADGGVRIQANTKSKGDGTGIVRDIDTEFAMLSKSLSKGYSKMLSKALESANFGGGFHWPLPRKYGYTGTWGHYKSGGSHPALDFPAPTGTPIYAVLPGKVEFTKSLGDTSFGNYTEIDHGHGIESLYAHESAFKTHAGARVNSGDTIGLVGAVGNTTGPHLHLELKRNGVSFDYTSWLHGGGPAWTQGGTGLPDKYDLTGSGVARYTPVVKDVLRALGQPAGSTLVGAVLARMQQESGGNPGIVNNWDPNAAAGTPSVGLMQVIGPTYQANKPHPDRGPYKYGTSVDPYSNIYAGLHYAEGRYPSIYYAMTKPGGYADGGIRDHGVDVFDNGGIWKHGRLGVNLSGRDEYVNDPQATAAAFHMANGGLIGPQSSGDSGNSGQGNRIHRQSGGNDITIHVPPGAIRSLRDLLEMVSKPGVHHNITDLNDAWRKMRNEAGKLTREERQLDRIRRRSKSSAKAVRQSEKELEQLRNQRDKATEHRKNLEDKLKDARRDGGADLKDIEKSERELAKLRKQASKNGKVSKSEQQEINQAEKGLNRQREQASKAAKKAHDIEVKLNKARHEENRDDKQVHRLRARLHSQREREKITAKDLAKQEKDVTKQRDKLNKATEKWRDLQKELIAQAREVADAITQQGDVFGGQGTSNTAQGLFSKLKGARSDAEDYGKLIKRAKRRGVSQGILDQILDQGSTPESLNLLQSLAHAPDSLIKKINRQEDRLDKIANQVGTWTIRGDGKHRRAQADQASAGTGRTINNNFNGPIYTQDPKAAAREINRQQRMGVLVAGGA